MGLDGLKRDAGAKGHITFAVVKVRCRCGNTGYRASNSSYQCKGCRTRLDLSLTGNRFPTVAYLAENMLSRSKEARAAVESIIRTAAPESTEKPSSSAAKELTARVVELEAEIAKIVEERDSEFSRMLSENRSLREEIVSMRSEVADIAETNRHLRNENS